MVYHINPENGHPGFCRAKKRCPFGDASEHYETKNKAIEAFEERMKGNMFTTHEPAHAETTALSDVMSLDLLRKNIDEGYIASRSHPDDEALKVLCYTKETQFDGAWNDATKIARGLIVRSEEEDFSDAYIVERPWRKFFTLEQIDGKWALGDEEAETATFNELDLIDFNAPAEVTDKADGSLGILYRAPDGLPAFATKGSFDSDQARYYTNMLRNDAKLAKQADDFLSNDSGKTHLFELTGPDNQIVLSYDEDQIILLGSVEKKDGLYRSANEDEGKWAHGVVETFQANNLEKALAIPDRENREGLVIRTISDDPEKQLQIKVKQEDYKTLHRIISSFSLKDARTAVRESEMSMSELMAITDHKDLSKVQSIAPLITTDINNVALKNALAQRRTLLESAMLPRAEKVVKAHDFIKNLDEKYFTSPTGRKDFAGIVKEQKELDSNDLFMFYQAKANNVNLDEVSASKILKRIAQSF